MEQTLQSQSLRAFDLIRQAAMEYSNTEYKFYQSGFFKYRIEGISIFIDDIYIIPEHRGTPVASDILEAFGNFIRHNNLQFLYGYVMKNDKNYQKRMDTFKRWGLTETNSNDFYSVVGIMVKDLR